MPYFRNEKGYRKNSNRFELQEPRGTGGEFSTKIRDKNSFRRWWVQTILEMYLTDLKAVKDIIIKRKVAKIL